MSTVGNNSNNNINSVAISSSKKTTTTNQKISLPFHAIFLVCLYVCLDLNICLFVCRVFFPLFINNNNKSRFVVNPQTQKCCKDYIEIGLMTSNIMLKKNNVEYFIFMHATLFN